MIPYDVSKAFSEMQQKLQGKGYQPQTYLEALSDLQNAIQFLNNDYNVLFKEICENPRSGTLPRRLEEASQKLRKSSTDQGYNVILLQALSRLENLRKKT